MCIYIYILYVLIIFHPFSCSPWLLHPLQDAHEYAQLPVRHNEDQLNSELAAKLPLQVNMSTMDSSNTKTHLLLQAHFSQLPLPSSDYNTDTKSVMDQAIRILQVSENTATPARKYLTTNKCAIKKVHCH